MMSALKALAAAKEAGIEVEVEGEELVLRGQDLFNEVADALIASKPDLMRVHRGREAARAILKSEPPPGCWRIIGRAPDAAFSPLYRRDGAIRRRSSAGQSMNCTKNRPSGDASISPAQRF
jgi:hypothetical protein